MSEISIDQHTIADWLDRLAAKTPVPGGGAVAALAGAIGAALGSMVLAYTRGKKTYAQHEEVLGEAATKLDRLRVMLLELADEDSIAYARLNELMKLPEDDPARQTEWGEAVREAIAVPRAGVATACTAARVLESLASISNPWLGSDLAIAADLAAASAKAFAWNVRVNLPQLEDQAEQDRLAEETSRLVGEAFASAQRVEQVVLSQLEA